MKNLLTVPFFLFLISSWVFAQEKTVEVVLEEGYSLDDADVTVNGNFFILQNSKGKISPKTKYTLWNVNFDLVQEYTDLEKFTYYEMDFASTNGKSILIDEKKQYDLITTERTKFGDEDINDDINDNFYYHKQATTRMIDALRLQFLTDQNFVAIGRKEGKEYWKKGKFEEIEIFIFKKNLQTLETNYTKLELPKDIYFDDEHPRMLYYDNDFFILSFISYKRIEGIRTYVTAKYDYSGKIIQENEMPIRLLTPDQDTAIVNYGSGSFVGYRPLNAGSSNPYDYRTILTYQFATIHSYGAIFYDKWEDAYYAYAAIKAKKGEDGVLIYKYDSQGNPLWNSYHILEDTNFKMLNSYNRYLTFDAAPNFLGISVFSTKGTNYCDFYILSKDTGEIITERKFKRYSMYGTSKIYNHLFAQFEIKDGDFDGLILDHSTIFAALYNKSFDAHLTKLNTKEPYLFNGFYTKEGINTVSSTKRGRKIILNKFKL